MITKIIPPFADSSGPLDALHINTSKIAGHDLFLVFQQICRQDSEALDYLVEHRRIDSFYIASHIVHNVINREINIILNPKPARRAMPNMTTLELSSAFLNSSNSVQRSSLPNDPFLTSTSSKPSGHHPIPRGPDNGNVSSHVGGFSTLRLKHMLP